MSDLVFSAKPPIPRGLTPGAPARRDIGIKRRYAAERRFRAYGIAAVTFGLVFLIALVSSVVRHGYTAFVQTSITLPIEFAEKVIDPTGKRASDPKVLIAANYPLLVRDALVKALGIDPADRALVREATAMVSDSARSMLRDKVMADPPSSGKR